MSDDSVQRDSSETRGETMPRRCRWFGHRWGDPVPVTMVVLDELVPLGGLRSRCQRCSAVRNYPPGSIVVQGWWPV